MRKWKSTVYECKKVCECRKVNKFKTTYKFKKVYEYKKVSQCKKVYEYTLKLHKCFLIVQECALRAYESILKAF